MYDFDRPRNAPREGDVRLPAGCAIAAIMDRSGARHDGSDILRSIALMHDRSNGLGGGFAADGIYPEYRDYYALHVFYDNSDVKADCEKFLERHFDIINLSRIPPRKLPSITDEPLIWR